jgi:serine/threonine-protein kinase
MFVDEARVTARLSHPNLVQVFDFGEDKGELFMAMELVEGTTCAKLVRTAAAQGEVTPIEISLFIIMSVLRGLDHAHNATDEHGVILNLVHRDVSPGNVMLSKSGSVKLGDFGIMRAYGIERRTEHGQLKGKLGYMSPEQVAGGEVDVRSDLFTVGIVLAELLIGRPLFSHGQDLDILLRIRDADTSTFSKYSQRLPEEIRAVVHKALAHNPDDRFPSAASFADTLEEFARRRRLVPGAPRLAAYLERLGLVPPAARSGEHPVVIPPTSTGGRSSQSAVFRAVLPTGAVVDSLTLPRVLELLITGAITGDSLVSRDEAAFVPAHEHPELKRIASASTHRWEATAEHLGECCPIGPLTTAAFLFDLAARRATGLVEAVSPTQRRKLYLNDGLLEFASSSAADDLLGRRLIDEGLCLPVEVDMALALAPKYGGKIGDALMGLGVLRPIELFRALDRQFRSRVVTLLSWQAGTLTFSGQVRCHDEALPAPIGFIDLVARGLAESVGLDEMKELLEPLRDEPLSRIPHTVLSASTLRLSENESAVLTAIDGRAAIDDLVIEMPRRGIAREVEVWRAIMIGLSAKLIRCETWSSRESTAG